jgi:hypothetical protein
MRRQVFAKGELVNDYVYEYAKTKRYRLRKRDRLPSSRYCVAGNCEGERVQYSTKGFIKAGKSVLDGIPYSFTYEYRGKAKFADELLRAKYTYNPLSRIPLNAYVWWCVPPAHRVDEPSRWVPYSKVTHAQLVQEENVYETKWIYDHKCHPTMSTLHNGTEASTPDLILHDQLKILTKPTSTSFVDEDPLLPFNSTSSGFFGRLFGMHKKVSLLSLSNSGYAGVNFSRENVFMEIVERFNSN